MIGKHRLTVQENGDVQVTALEPVRSHKAPPRHAGIERAGLGYGRSTTTSEGAAMSPDPRYEQEETDAAAAEAARIGGVAGDEDLDPAQRPVVEGGGGEAEGFEQAEEALIEHASHGDQQSAHAVIHDAGRPEEAGTSEDGEADYERSSEREGDDR
jgi:hypothetical protein